MAGILFIGVINVRTSLMAELDNILNTLFNYEVQVFLNDSYPASGLQQRAEAVPGVSETASQAFIRGQRIKPDGTEGSAFGIVGVAPSTDFFQPKIISGRWLNEDDRNAMVITSNLAEAMPDVQAGDSITLKIGDKDYTWNVVGIMLMAFDRNGYASFDYVYRSKLFHDEGNYCLFQRKPV
jgi:hypothetical protein